MPEQTGRPTIKTIAKLAGVSHVTVSHALRDFHDISKETKEKIKRIAAEIGYTPNAAARSLTKGQASTIGMIVPSMDFETAYNKVFSAVSKAAIGADLCVLLGNCDRDIELEKMFCRRMAENRVGALLISPVSSEIEHIKSICANVVPLIFMGGKTGAKEEPYISMDYYESGQTAVEYLFSLGHRDIAFFIYAPENMTILQKQRGYEDAMLARGLTPAVFCEGDSSDTLTAGKKLIGRLISENKIPTAIWCASDLMAVGALDELRHHGLSVPGDVSVMGHDDLYLGRLRPLSLTTLAIPDDVGIKAVELALAIMNRGKEDKETEELALSVINRGSKNKKAMELALAVMNRDGNGEGEKAESLIRNYIFKAELIERGSTGPNTR